MPHVWVLGPVSTGRRSGRREGRHVPCLICLISSIRSVRARLPGNCHLILYRSNTRLSGWPAAGAGATTGAGRIGCGDSAADGGEGTTGFCVAVIAAGLVAKIGAGCGPFCMYKALTKIVTTATPPRRPATHSRG